MKSFTRLSVILLTVAAFAALTSASYGIVIDMVAVGDPGNASDTNPDAVPPGAGDVAYTYKIAKTETTNAQYAEFLSAVSTAGVPNPYGLYHGSMLITDNGAGSYTASVGDENKPAAYASWGDAVRFANWLHNGAPTAAAGAGVTESGAYDVNEAVDNAGLLAVTRQAGAKWFLPNSDEWFKAAFYDPRSAAAGGPPGDDNYWKYPTQSDSDPTAEGPSAGSNSANYNNAVGSVVDVGSYPNSDSYYGTLDQGGNLNEWNEDLRHDLTDSKIMRGGAYNSGANRLYSGPVYPADTPITSESYGTFRIAQIPEPGSIALLVIGLLGLPFVARRKRK